MEQKDIAALVGPFESGVHGVLIVLRAEAFVELYGGTPQPGVLLAPDTAREFARQILTAADAAEERDGRKGV
jgi:hypothetical protein